MLKTVQFGSKKGDDFIDTLNPLDAYKKLAKVKDIEDLFDSKVWSAIICNNTKYDNIYSAVAAYA